MNNTFPLAIAAVVAFMASTQAETVAPRLFYQDQDNDGRADRLADGSLATPKVLTEMASNERLSAEDAHVVVTNPAITAEQERSLRAVIYSNRVAPSPLPVVNGSTDTAQGVEPRLNPTRKPADAERDFEPQSPSERRVWTIPVDVQ